MKTSRFLFAVAITLAAAACSSDVTAPESTIRADDSAAALEEGTPTTTPTPEEPVEGDNGAMGSGVGR
jgi:hypothetical protein